MVAAIPSSSHTIFVNAKRNKAHSMEWALRYIRTLVPKRGLEPPLPCENVDLNHARLPIPPFRLTSARSGILPHTCCVRT